MAANSWLCQFLADMLNLPIYRPPTLEVTARGAALLAGMAVGLWTKEIVAPNAADSDLFLPTMADAERDALRDGWRDAIERTLMDSRA